MGADQNIDWAKTAASVLEWWRDAGVDVLVEDAPCDWLAPSPEPAAAATATVSATALPDTIEAFLAWRLSADAPEADWGGARIAASGPVDADLMVLVDCPEREDGEILMSGAAGKLFDRMLAAIGRSRADVHLAALCITRPVAGRMPREIETRLSEIARHHVALVASKRLLVMGNAASRAIRPTDASHSRENLPVVNHKSGKMTTVVTSFHPRFLLEKPAAKAEAWRDLQMLIGGLT